MKNKRKVTKEKANRDAEVQHIEDKHCLDREQASNDINAIPKMIASENIYNCIMRIERIFTTKNIPEDMCAGALGEVFTGYVLEQYSLHVHAFSWNYEELNNALIQTCGFRTHDYLNFYRMIYSSTSSSCWAKETSY